MDNTKPNMNPATRRRTILSILAILIALALFICGAGLHTINVYAPKDVKSSDTKQLKLAEPAVVKDITIGGLVRLDNGQIKRTYAAGQAPALCPT